MITNWYNENEFRCFPLSETSTQVDDNGNILPSNIIVDLSIVSPKPYNYIMIGSIYVSSFIISLSIVCDGEDVLIGTFSRSSIIPYKIYSLDPLKSDFSGSIVFGNINAIVSKSYKFSSPSQSAIDIKCIKVIRPPYVNKFYKKGVENSATGFVKLIAGNGFIIESDKNDPYSVVIKLNDEMKKSLVDKNSVPPTSNNSKVPAIRRINNVKADNNGVIKLRFE